MREQTLGDFTQLADFQDWDRYLSPVPLHTAINKATFDFLFYWDLFSRNKVISVQLIENEHWDRYLSPVPIPPLSL